MNRIIAWPLTIVLVACSAGTNDKDNPDGSTNSGQCNMTVTGTPHAGTGTTCTTLDRGGGFMQLGIELPGCTGGSCALSVVVPQASGTVSCQPMGSITAVSYQETGSTGVTAQGWTGCGEVGDGGVCLEQGTCTVNVSSFTLQGSSAPFGHFSGTITAHLVPNPGLPGGTTMDVSANGSW